MTGDARIYERGFRHYDGPRRGPSGPFRTVVVQTLLRSLGWRRSLWLKLFPMGVAGLAYVPAIVFAGVIALLGRRVAMRTDLVPDYPAYYGFVSAAILGYASFVGPEVLISDRTTGLLDLALSSPLTLARYLLAKFTAVAASLAVVTIGPVLVLLIAYSAQGVGPEGLGGFALTLVRILAAGIGVSAALTSVSLAIAACTDRKPVASAGVIVVALGSAAVTGVLVNGLDYPAWVSGADLVGVPFELAHRIYGQEGPSPEMATWQVVGANLAWVAGSVGVLVTRYRKLTS